MTGFCRITVVAPNVRVDVALPEDVPLAELLPDVLRMADQWQSEGAHAGFVLARLDGSELDTGVSLAAQDVHNGDLLYLRPATEMLPPPVYDDVVDAIAQAVGDDRRMWGGANFRQVGLAIGAILFGVGAYVLFNPAQLHGTAGFVAAVFAAVLVVAGGLRSRVYGDHIGGAVLAAISIVYAFIAGLGIPAITLTSGLGRTHFTSACCTAFLAGLIGTFLVARHSEACLAGTLAAAAGAIAGGIGVAVDAPGAKIAAGAGTVAIAAIGFLPGLALRFVRFPMPQLIDGAPQIGNQGTQRAGLPAGSDDPVDVGDIERRAARGHELLTGLTAACALTVLISTVTLSFSTTNRDGGPWAIGMAAVLSLALFSRARLFRRAGQVGTLFWGGGLAGAVVLIGASTHVAANSRSTWYFGVVLLAGLIMLAVGIALPDRTLTPRWARTVDLMDGLLLAAVIPVLLGVMQVYGMMQSVVH
jgi:type VII secretion integral membrane protein EccD